jgi:hypothetical protein
VLPLIEVRDTVAVWPFAQLTVIVVGAATLVVFVMTKCHSVETQL